MVIIIDFMVIIMILWLFNICKYDYNGINWDVLYIYIMIIMVMVMVIISWL